MRRATVAGFILALPVLCSGAVAAQEKTASGSITSPKASPGSFNPSLGQPVSLSFEADRNGGVEASVLDRDGFVIRQLPAATVSKGKNSVTWDGKDDSGTVVPDDAYTFRLVFSDGKVKEVYDPAKGFKSQMAEGKPTYARATGVLTYSLEQPSRVHVQAGVAVVDKKTGKADGPIMKTVVDHRPRAPGSVAEVWNGYDESGTIYIPDLSNFVIGIMATSLPENAVITIGNQKETFAAYALRTRTSAALKPRVVVAPKGRPAHHEGLSALEDRSPGLAIGLPPSGAAGSSLSWKAGEDLKLTLRLGEGAEYFLSQPTGISVYLDGKGIREVKSPKNPAEVVLKTAGWLAGERVLAVNWGSEMGPVAVNSVKVTVVK